MLESSSSSSSSKPLATFLTNSSAPFVPSSRRALQRKQPRDLSVSGVAKNRSQSAGSNWEAEFAQYSDAEQLQKASKHLELTWKVTKVMSVFSRLAVFSS